MGTTWMDRAREGVSEQASELQARVRALSRRVRGAEAELEAIRCGSAGEQTRKMELGTQRGS